MFKSEFKFWGLVPDLRLDLRFQIWIVWEAKGSRSGVLISFWVKLEMLCPKVKFTCPVVCSHGSHFKSNSVFWAILYVSSHTYFIEFYCISQLLFLNIGFPKMAEKLPGDQGADICLTRNIQKLMAPGNGTMYDIGIWKELGVSETGCREHYILTSLMMIIFLFEIDEFHIVYLQWGLCSNTFAKSTLNHELKLLNQSRLKFLRPQSLKIDFTVGVYESFRSGVTRWHLFGLNFGLQKSLLIDNVKSPHKKIPASKHAWVWEMKSQKLPITCLWTDVLEARVCSLANCIFWLTTYCSTNKW